MSLDYLTEDNDVAETLIDIDGKIMPAKIDKIALIDADTLAYTACLNTEECEALLPWEMYTEDEILEIEANPNYDEEACGIWTINIDIAYDKAMEKLQRILDKTGCQDAEMYFTHGKNFRYTVDSSYKAHRTGRAPTGLYELKKKLNNTFPGEICEEIEADDIVVYKARAEPEKYVMVAVDKDLLYAVPGIHFNYYESARYNIEMKWMPECDSITAITWPYKQAIIGDTADNIKGIKGMGPAAANKVFAGCNSEKECWDALVLTYESKGKSSIEALQTMQLVHMHQWDGTNIQLFNPRKIV